MKIVFVHGYMFNAQAWAQVCGWLHDEGIDLHLFTQHQSAQKAMDFMKSENVDIFIGSLFHDLPWCEELLESSKKAKIRAGLGWDMPNDFSSFSEDVMLRFNQFLAKISAENYANGIRYLAASAGMNISWQEEQPVQTHGVYHPDAPEIFSDISDYYKWFLKRASKAAGLPVIGILCYYGQIVENNRDDIDAVIQCFEKNEMIPLCVCSEGGQDAALPIADRYPWLEYFKKSAADNDFGLSCIMNLMAGRLLAAPSDAFILEKLNVPVFQMIRLHKETPEQWAQDTGGLGSGFTLVYGLAQPEMAGTIEPTMAAGTVPEPHASMDITLGRYAPVSERIEHICRRVMRWVRLREKPNYEKRVTIILNNNPCKGVEATLGVAAGLDTFESLAKVISVMRQDGYNVGDAPEDGQSLLDLFLERKAVSEFRWTTVDEIVNKGGALHLMGREEYQPWFETLPGEAKKKVLEDWGEFPGQGMMYQHQGKDVLVITGLEFGNLKIMIQPKRGCYGPKCNGEVCRILHDPELSPPHHWLAVYHYIHKTSDVMIHFGTHGALEFLPGKRAALSAACFPEISLGDLPNLYVYVMDVPGDGVVAKRRGRAVMVDHLTPVYSPATLDDTLLELERLAGEYLNARDNRESGREASIREKMIPLMQSSNLVDPEAEADFDAAAGLLSRRIAQIRRTLAPAGMHVLGTAPNAQEAATMLATILMKPTDDLPSLEAIAAASHSHPTETFSAAADVIRSVIKSDGYPDEKVDKAGLSSDFLAWCRDVSGRVAMSTREIPQLLRALNGEYIEPGLSGSLNLGKTQTLPTGRNFFTVDVSSLPTHSAWQVGRTLADNLLEKYILEEGRFPESVGISLWSIDAFKSDGEVFCQILHLMGMQPVWNPGGKVTGVRALPAEDLSLTVEGKTYCPRPRIDVVIQTSGILRDMVPHFADLIDEAAVLAAGLDESHELNYIRKHSDERMAELKADLGDRFSESEMARMASFRVFSSAPGTYGIGVGLALDASAWEDEKDLAETYVNWGGYAYCSSRDGNYSRASGREAHQIYAKNLRTVEVSYMRQYSPEYDLLDCGCYAGFLGGMAVATKAAGGKAKKVYWADSNPAGDLSVRDVKDDIETSAKARLLNKNWIGNQKKHGYKGAGGVSSRVNNLFKWSATTGKVGKWVYDEVVNTYINDAKNLEWLRKENPYALEELTRRLIEAESRGLWQADTDMLESVRQAALMVEGDMEEIMGEVQEEFQGSKIDVMTAADVEKWQPKWRFNKEVAK